MERLKQRTDPEGKKHAAEPEGEEEEEAEEEELRRHRCQRPQATGGSKDAPSLEPGFLYASSRGALNIPPLSSHQKAGLVRDQKITYTPWILKGSNVSMGPSCL